MSKELSLQKFIKVNRFVYKIATIVLTKPKQR